MVQVRKFVLAYVVRNNVDYWKYLFLLSALECIHPLLHPLPVLPKPSYSALIHYL